MFIICGLGNPGKQYELTRHNMGFRTIDTISDKCNIPVKNLKFKALCGEGQIGNEKVILVKPQTFMNLSGESLREIVAYYKISPEKLVVIYDDIDLPPGQLRIRTSGSSGSHNGMKSVIYQLQFDNFPRIRIGIGNNGIIPLESYVVSKPSPAEESVLNKAIINAADAAEMIASGDAAAAMQKYNVKNAD